jgi:hypothetical protein
MTLTEALDEAVAGAAEKVIAGTPGVFRISLAQLVPLRDQVYRSDPGRFVGAEIAFAGDTAYVSFREHPATFLQVDSDHRVSTKDMDVLPGVATFVGAVDSDTSARHFWRVEATEMHNLIVAVAVVLVVAAAVYVRGLGALSVILGALAIFYAVSLPIIPIFFRPAMDVGIEEFFRTGRLMKWQTAESQVLRAAIVGFAITLSLAAIDPSSSPQGIPTVVAWALTTLVTLIAVWLLLVITTYALPVIHALDRGRAVRSYLQARAKE